MRRTIVLIAAAALLIGAFYYGQKQVDRLNFVAGTKAEAQCKAARQARDLWSKMEKLILVSPAGVKPEAKPMVAAIHAYVANNPTCDLKAPR